MTALSQRWVITAGQCGPPGPPVSVGVEVVLVLTVKTEREHRGTCILSYGCFRLLTIHS